MIFRNAWGKKIKFPPVSPQNIFACDLWYIKDRLVSWWESSGWESQPLFCCQVACWGILATWKEEGSLQTPPFISRGKRDRQSLNLRERIRNQSEQQIISERTFPVVHTMCLLFISPHVPAVSTSAPSGAVSLFSLAPFPLAYCFFFSISLFDNTSFPRPCNLSSLHV